MYSELEDIRKTAQFKTIDYIDGVRDGISALRRASIDILSDCVPEYIPYGPNFTKIIERLMGRADVLISILNTMHDDMFEDMMEKMRQEDDDRFERLNRHIDKLEELITETDPNNMEAQNEDIGDDAIAF